MQRQLSVRQASRGVDRRRGRPNNHLQDLAGIPNFHPRIHLNNDAGKLSRLMVATRKYKETYDMQASRREATWFNMQKLVVNNYALGILVFKVTTTPQGSQLPRTAGWYTKTRLYHILCQAILI
jgi:hypothetical protein